VGHGGVEAGIRTEIVLDLEDGRDDGFEGGVLRFLGTGEPDAVSLPGIGKVFAQEGESGDLVTCAGQEARFGFRLLHDQENGQGDDIDEFKNHADKVGSRISSTRDEPDLGKANLVAADLSGDHGVEAGTDAARKKPHGKSRDQALVAALEGQPQFAGNGLHELCFVAAAGIR
ncbi:MAG: hypothetical protein ACK56I_16375, partial [bacterium]